MRKRRKIISTKGIILVILCMILISLTSIAGTLTFMNVTNGIWDISYYDDGSIESFPASKAIIDIGNKTITINVKTWTYFNKSSSSNMIRIIARDGEEYVVDKDNCLLIK